MDKSTSRIVKHADESEKALERLLCERIRALGLLCLKYSNAQASGYPDRLVVLPGGSVLWVELKSKGQKPRKLQTERHKELLALGHGVWVLDERDLVESFCDAVARKIEILKDGKMEIMGLRTCRAL